MKTKFNPFHLVETSPWPILISWVTLSMVMTSLLFINKKSSNLILTSLLMILLISYMWWKNIHSEASSQGNHSTMVMNGLKTGMIMFISSEVLFFVSFFWAFFHNSVSPILEMGQSWPPNVIQPFNPMGMPLLNTILLLSSGVTVTWCHHAILKSYLMKAKVSIYLTISLGLLFSLLQGFEYKEATFSISDSCFGTTFFMATGFHGLHVIIGSLFLIVSALRINKMINSTSHMIGFECAAWYWHFVDVVWLFLYSMLYWWGS